MNVLAIDTTSPDPAVALLADGRLVEESLPSDRRSSEELLPAVRRVLSSAGRRLEECDRVAVCAGPGSFTGVRVGLATAWGFRRALGIAVEPVSTLEAMAEAARPAGVSRLLAVLDAGRGELIGERFSLEEPRARSLGSPFRFPQTEVARQAAGEPVVALPAGIGGAGGLAPRMRIASGLALAVSRAPRRDWATAAAIYSRPSAAEERHGAP